MVTAEWVRQQALVADHPIEESTHRGQVFIEGLRRLILVAPPSLERIRSHIHQKAPVALVQEAINELLHIIVIIPNCNITTLIGIWQKKEPRSVNYEALIYPGTGLLSQLVAQ